MCIVRIRPSKEETAIKKQGSFEKTDVTFCK